MLWKTQKLFALFHRSLFYGAVQKVEHKSRAGPLSTNNSCNTVEVENVFAPVCLDTGFVAQTFRVAHFTVRVFLCIFDKLLVNQNTVLM
jgi:hypothetical protein